METTRTRSLSDAQRATLMENMRLAEQLGAETVTLIGDDIADEIVSYARSQDVTRIVIGKSRAAALADVSSGPTSSTDCCARAATSTSTSSRGMAEGGQAPPAPAAARRGAGAATRRPSVWWSWRGRWPSSSRGPGCPRPTRRWSSSRPSIGAAMWWGLWPGVVAAVASVLAFDFFFVPPYYTFAVQRRRST